MYLFVLNEFAWLLEYEKLIIDNYSENNCGNTILPPTALHQWSLEFYKFNNVS